MVKITCNKCRKQTGINFDNCQHCGNKLKVMPVRYSDDKKQITSQSLSKPK